MKPMNHRTASRSVKCGNRCRVALAPEGTPWNRAPIGRQVVPTSAQSEGNPHYGSITAAYWWERVYPAINRAANLRETLNRGVKPLLRPW